MEKYEELGLRNQFGAPDGSAEVNFRNGTDARDNVTSIEIRKPSEMSRAISLTVDPADNIGMAIAVLGVGRVDEKVESRAKGYASEGSGYTEDEMVDVALVWLRAVMMRREKQEAERRGLIAKQGADAYALYLLSHGGGVEVLESLEEFNRSAESVEWVNRLEGLRRGIRMGGF